MMVFFTVHRPPRRDRIRCTDHKKTIQQPTIVITMIVCIMARDRPMVFGRNSTNRGRQSRNESATRHGGVVLEPFPD